MSEVGAVGEADFVVVANRLPVDLERTEGQPDRWKRSPGGLVTALEPVLRSQDGAWVGWAGVPDADVEPFVDDGLTLHPVRLSAADVTEYYEGFANGTLWPLYHDVVVPPEFNRTWWDTYVKVNRRFAEATARTAGPGATVWIQDYQLQLVPKLLRELRPDLLVGFFLHIPFPPVELFMQLPSRTEIVEGLLGADLIGFHLPGGAQNFLYLARRLAGQHASRAAVGVRSRPGTVQVGDRTVRVGAFPISIDSTALSELAHSPRVQARAKEIRRDLGHPRCIMLGVDRLDYTKGIDVRLFALRELLAEGRIDADDTVMIQLATPSRERVEEYIKMRGEIEREVGGINGEFAKVGHPAVHYLHQPVPREELVAFFVAADVMLVTPVRDGMNLVAKEYVACHGDHTGALVLSEFAGAAAELHSAYLVNPHDLDGVKDAMIQAVEQTEEEGHRRMRNMRRQVMTFDVSRWAQSFLAALGRPDLAEHTEIDS
ncbi:MAG: trehalose-6-phosphate synthase [Mycobacteriaceae bacterium]